MATWTSITSLLAGFQPDLPALATKFRNLTNNVQAMGERAPNAPRSLPLMEVFTTVGAGSYTVEAGVTRIKVTAQGGGNGDGSAVGDTTVTVNGVTIAGNKNGTATGGDLNIEGGGNGVSNIGASEVAQGGGSYLSAGSCAGLPAGGYGGGGYVNTAGTGCQTFNGGGCAIKTFDVSAGDIVSFNVGASDGNGSSSGIVIIEH